MGKGRHPERALSAVRVRAITKPGRYADGNGLYLVVDRSGAKRWLLRTVVRGKRCDIGLGGLKLLTLSEARENAATYRKMARAGGDPLAARRRERAVVPTFAEAARSVHAAHSASWKNEKHAAQWMNTLAEYVFPALGDRRVDHIDTPDVLRVLSPIWLAKPETARRVRQRVRTVMDWAKAAGYRAGENPVDGVAKGLPRQPDRAHHHAALPYARVPEFIRQLRESVAGEPARLAFEFLVLTATRTNEVLRATWREVEWGLALWIVPPGRMKSAREHRVPLSTRCFELLARAKELSSGSDYIFPGRSLDKPLSDMVFLMMLRRMQLEVTAHGFRSSFRDWASECTSFPREVCELALAHAIDDKTEAAYRRGDLLEKRRELMAAWALFVTSAVADDVIPSPTADASRVPA
jgi:integrase